MPDFISHEYFHLVGRKSPADGARNFETLMKILREGCIRNANASPNQSPVSVSIDLTKSLASGELVVPTMTCYADIPYRDLKFHAAKYGAFGLSFDCNFLIQRGARPVTYIPMTADDRSTRRGEALLRDLEGIYRAYRMHLLEPQRAARDPPHLQHYERVRRVGAMPDKRGSTIEALDTMLTLDFLGYLKPYDSQVPESDPNYFYSEREWRMTTHLRFTPSEVARVVITDEYRDRLGHAMPEYVSKMFPVIYD